MLRGCAFQATTDFVHMDRSFRNKTIGKKHHRIRQAHPKTVNRATTISYFPHTVAVSQDADGRRNRFLLAKDSSARRGEQNEGALGPRDWLESAKIMQPRNCTRTSPPLSRTRDMTMRVQSSCPDKSAQEHETNGVHDAQWMCFRLFL